VFASNGATLVASLDKKAAFPYEGALFAGIALVVASSLLFFWLFSFVASRMLINPVNQLVLDMRSIGGKTLKDRIPASKSGYVNWLIKDINTLLDRIENYSRRAFTTQEQMYEAKVRLLGKQINAHFTFNTLSTISEMAMEAGLERIAEASDGLAALIREAHEDKGYVNVYDEMQVLEKYINIMNLRHNGKFNVELDIDESLCDCVIMRQLLQPVVENAFLHGLERKASDAQLLVSGRKKGGFIVFEIKDNGSGMPLDKLEELNARLDGSGFDQSMSGIALANIAQRIRLAHGEGYGIMAESDGGLRVVITLPALKDH
jgi:two-component system sensor histidine kinase YesM